MMDINDAKEVIKGLQEKTFICSENAIETDNGYVIKRIPKKYSKADKIRSMNDEELAKHISELGCNCCPVNEDVSICCTAVDNCKKAVLLWLQSEAE